MEHFIKASQFVSRMSQKYMVNKLYVWDILEEEFNIIKGLGCYINKEEMEIAEERIKADED